MSSFSVLKIITFIEDRSLAGCIIEASLGAWVTTSTRLWNRYITQIAPWGVDLDSKLLIGDGFLDICSDPNCAYFKAKPFPSLHLPQPTQPPPNFPRVIPVSPNGTNLPAMFSRLENPEVTLDLLFLLPPTSSLSGPPATLSCEYWGLS